MTTFQFPARLPADVKDWLQQQASLHGSSMNSEVIRALRERMNRVSDERRWRFPHSTAGAELAKRMAQVLFDADMDIEKNEEGGPCQKLLIEHGFDPEEIELLSKRTWFEFYELLSKVPGVIPYECSDEPLLHHIQHPEFVE